MCRTRSWVQILSSHNVSVIMTDVDVDGAKRVANALDLGGVVRHGHLLLAYVVQLLAELKFSCGCVHRENFRRFSHVSFGILALLM